MADNEGYSSCPVCVYVCPHTLAILAVRAIKSITKDTIVFKHQIFGNIKIEFFNCLIRKLERFSLTSAGAAIFS